MTLIVFRASVPCADQPAAGGGVLLSLAGAMIVGRWQRSDVRLCAASAEGSALGLCGRGVGRLQSSGSLTSLCKCVSHPAGAWRTAERIRAAHKWAQRRPWRNFDQSSEGCGLGVRQLLRCRDACASSSATSRRGVSDSSPWCPGGWPSLIRGSPELIVTDFGMGSLPPVTTRGRPSRSLPGLTHGFEKETRR
jgi:hypothetical protein